MSGARDGKMAIYPGTFDPITNGHLDIIERSSRLFDQVVVAIAESSDKQPLFDLEARAQLIRGTIRPFDNVVVETFGGLLVDYVRRRGGSAIVRGLRAISDFEYEFQMALMNRRLDDRIETVFMMPAEAYSYLSSRLVKEIASLGGDISGLVPEAVATAMEERLAGKRSGE